MVTLYYNNGLWGKRRGNDKVYADSSPIAAGTQSIVEEVVSTLRLDTRTGLESIRGKPILVLSVLVININGMSFLTYHSCLVTLL